MVETALLPVLCEVVLWSVAKLTATAKELIAEYSPAQSRTKRVLTWGACQFCVVAIIGLGAAVSELSMRLGTPVAEGIGLLVFVILFVKGCVVSWRVQSVHEKTHEDCRTRMSPGFA